MSITHFFNVTGINYVLNKRKFSIIRHLKFKICDMLCKLRLKYNFSYKRSLKNEDCRLKCQGLEIISNPAILLSD